MRRIKAPGAATLRVRASSSETVVRETVHTGPAFDGVDPRRPAAPTVAPFRAVVERFLHEYAAEKQAESTRAETKRILNKEVLPYWTWI